DGNLVVRFDAEHGKRYTDMVVEIALRRINLQTAREYRVEQFFGRRLAVGAGECQNRNIQAIPMKPGQLLQRFQRVWNDQITFALRELGLIYHSIACPLRERVCGKLVCVKTVAPQGKEYGPGHDLARVGRNTCRFQEFAVELGNTHCTQLRSANYLAGKITG